jgi:hypothetical protein
MNAKCKKKKKKKKKSSLLFLSRLPILWIEEGKGKMDANKRMVKNNKARRRKKNGVQGQVIGY